MDVVETAAGIEIVVDLPGVSEIGPDGRLLAGHAHRRRTQVAWRLRSRSRHLPSRGTQLRTLRARHPAERRLRCRQGERNALGRRAPRPPAADRGAARPRDPASRLPRPPMKILFIGDIFGKPGRDIVRKALPALVDRHQIDFVIANVRELGGGIRRHRRHRRRDPRLRRRRDDVGQPHLGQEGSPGLHPAPAEAAASRRISPQACPAAAPISDARAPANRSGWSTSWGASS